MTSGGREVGRREEGPNRNYSSSLVRNSLFALHVWLLALSPYVQPHVHLTSFTWWMTSYATLSSLSSLDPSFPYQEFPVFAASSTSVYYPERKVKNKKRGRPGNEAISTPFDLDDATHMRKVPGSLCLHNFIAHVLEQGSLVTRIYIHCKQSQILNRLLLHPHTSGRR